MLNYNYLKHLQYLSKRGEKKVQHLAVQFMFREPEYDRRCQMCTHGTTCYPSLLADSLPALPALSCRPFEICITPVSFLFTRLKLLPHTLFVKVDRCAEGREKERASCAKSGHGTCIFYSRGKYLHR